MPTNFSTDCIYIYLVSIIYSVLSTLRQIDIKKLIAYSSIVHMNFATLGLFTVNWKHFLEVRGNNKSRINFKCLFLCVGIIYDRYHTRLIHYYCIWLALCHFMQYVFLTYTWKRWVSRNKWLYR